MLRADRRVVVSHVGSLVRPPAMIPYLEKIRDKQPYDEAAFEKCLTDSVAEALEIIGLPRSCSSSCSTGNVGRRCR